VREESGDEGGTRREMIQRLGLYGAVTAPVLLAALSSSPALAVSGSDPCIPPLGEPIPPECGGLGGEL
jgi:hypothetical protein